MLGSIIGSKCLRLFVPIAVIAFLAVIPGTLWAQKRFLVPQEDPGGPFYARIEFGLVHHTDEWAAIAFYRDLDCVPGQPFNLLRFFDPNVPRAFSCPLTVHGFIIYRDPAPGAAPMQSRMQGNGAVPVWFVRWDELQAAIADNKLYIGELEGLPSLKKGTALFFEETLHPTGGSVQTMLELAAFGILEDGRAFAYQVTEVKGNLVHVKIDFR